MSHAHLIKKESMKLKIGLIVIIFIFQFSCKSDQINKLRINTTFSAKETDQIIEMLHRFDSEICINEQKEIDVIEDCYASFFKRIKKETDYGKLDIGISEVQQDFIISALDKSLRKEFWAEGIGVLNRVINATSPPKTYHDTIKVISIGKGMFLDFLKNDVSAVSSKVKDYYERYLNMGVTPTIEADIITNYEEYDISDERIRLFIAVHYLTKNSNILYSNLSYEKSWDDFKRETKNNKETKNKN